MHVRRKYRTPNAIEVQEFNSARVPGEHKRRPKEKPTSERVAKNNQRRKQREASRMVDAYFNEDDLVLTLTYRDGERPEDIQGALKHFRKLTDYLRREYAKRYYELFWMRNVEIGPRGGTHIHMILNRIEGSEWLVKEFWRRYGGVYMQYMQDMHDQGKDIGEYITKSAQSTGTKEDKEAAEDKEDKEDKEESGKKARGKDRAGCEGAAKTKGRSAGEEDREAKRIAAHDHKVVDSSWGHSRNVKKVPPEDKVISGHSMHDEPRCPKGYYLDKNSMYEGENAGGYPYRTYIFRRIKKRRIGHRMKPAQIRKLQKAKAGKGKKCKRKS